MSVFINIVVAEDTALALLCGLVDVFVSHSCDHLHVRFFELFVKLRHLFIKQGLKINVVQYLGHSMAVVKDLVLKVDHAIAVQQNKSLINRVRNDLSQTFLALVELRSHVVLRLPQVLDRVEHCS